MKNADIIAQFADIQPPPAPDSGAWILMAIVVSLIAVTLAVAIIYIYRYRGRHRPTAADAASHRLEALQRLQTLEQGWISGQIDDRQVAFRLAALLRLGLGDAQWPNPVGATDSEQTLVEALIKLRYERMPRIPLDQTLFSMARARLNKDAAPAC